MLYMRHTVEDVMQSLPVAISQSCGDSWAAGISLSGASLQRCARAGNLSLSETAKRIDFPVSRRIPNREPTVGQAPAAGSIQLSATFTFSGSPKSLSTGEDSLVGSLPWSFMIGHLM
jgi:hypothetical protein